MSDYLPDWPDRPTSPQPEPALEGRHPSGSPAASTWNADERGVSFRRFLSVVRRFKWMILLVAVVGTGIGVAAANYIDPVFLAQSTVWIETGNDENGQGPIQSAELLHARAWADLLKSYEVLEPVVREERLYLGVVGGSGDADVLGALGLKPGFTPGRYQLAMDDADGELLLLDDDGVVVDRGPAGDSLGEELGLAWTPSGEHLEAGERTRFQVHAPRSIARRLREELRTEIDNGSFLRVGMEGVDPERITRTINSVTERFVEVAGNLKRARLEELTSILEQQLRYARENLQNAERRLEDFRVRTITMPADRAAPVAAGLAETRDPVFSNFFDMKLEEDQLRRDRRAIERALAQAGDSALPVAALEVIPAVRESSELLQALGELTEKRAELRSLGYRYTDEHPSVVALREEIGVLETRVVPRLARGLAGELGEREAMLSERIASASRELQEIPVRSIEEARLERRVSIAAELYTMLQSRYEEARLATASSIPDLRILDHATVPQGPVKNTRPQVIAMTVLGALALALLLAVLLDRLDSRFNYPEQVTNEMGLTILGAVPFIPSRGRGLDDEMTAQVIEAFRTIRLAVSHAYGAAGPLMFTVSSPGVGDGKSLVATNVAIAFADLGKRTLLIDGDSRRGSLHRFYGASRTPGLTDYLEDGAAKLDVVRNVRGSLDLVTCGTRTGAAPELLSSSAMRDFLADARAEYEVVVIDSPPLSAGVDPFVLSSLTGNLLLVLRTGETNRELAAAKLEMVERLPVRVLGAVLNAIPSKGVYRYRKYYSYMPGYALEAGAGESRDRLALQQA